MKKQITYALLATFVFSLFILSCEQDVIDAEANLSPEERAIIQDQNRKQFAQLFAKAITNESVRKIIKKEALKRFDNDTDVLFQLIKDKPLSNGETLEDYIVSFSDDKEVFKSIITNDPLLTIYVPKLENFTATTWDIENQTPIIAVMNEIDNDKEVPMLSYDEDGNIIELDYRVKPKVPTLVVKTNERVQYNQMSSSDNRRSEAYGVIQTESGSFSFTSPSYNGLEQPKENARESNLIHVWSFIDPKLREAYSLNAPCQRDYVYYDILDNQDRAILWTESSGHFSHA